MKSADSGKTVSANRGSTKDSNTVTIDLSIPEEFCGPDEVGSLFQASSLPVSQKGDTSPPAIKESKCTDLANGQRFAQQWSGKAKFVPAWGVWLVWDGTRWAKDDLKSVVELAKKTARSIYKEASRSESDKELESLVKWAKLSAGADGIRRMLSMASSDPRLVARASDFDGDPYLLNTPAGTINLRTGELMAHKPSDMLTKITTVAPGTGNAPRWDAFLTETFGGQEDLIGYVQRMLGYSLLGTVREHILPICWGSGANGKSTLFETVQSVLGEYAAPADPNLLLAKRQDAHPTGIADLQGLRFVTCQETGQNRALDEAGVKNLTGGTERKARVMRGDFFRYIPSDTIWLATNHLPTIRNTDQGIWRRLKLIPFTNEVPPEKQDPDLTEKLTKGEGASILTWLVEGCLAYLQEGLGQCKAVTDATANYRSESDLIGQFINERCEKDVNAVVLGSALFRGYVEWAQQSHVRILDKNSFAREIEERGFKKVRRNTGSNYLGLELIDIDILEGKWAAKESAPEPKVTDIDELINAA